MRKYNKNMGIILSGVVIATTTQITTLSYALEDNKIQTKLEKNIEEDVIQTSDYSNQEIVEVRNQEELIAALKNPSIKIVDIKNDIAINIDIAQWDYINIYGNGKEIKGNGYTVSSSENSAGTHIIVNTNTKLDNLKLNKAKIECKKGNSLDIVNNSEINNVEIYFEGKVLLENVKINNTDMSGHGDLVVNLSKIKDSIIRPKGYKSGIVKITNTEINSGQEISNVGDRKFKVPIYLYGGNIELENIKITNPGRHAIYAEGAIESRGKIRIKGTLEIDGAEKEAILLKTDYNSNKDNPIELYIDGDIKQKGDTYTVKAEKEGTHTKVYYDESKIKKGTDLWSNAYYNTKNREGNEPQFPEYENQEIVEVRNEEDLIVALKNPRVKTVEIKNDIVVKADNHQGYYVIDIDGNEKEIKGNGYTVSGSRKDININVNAKTKIDNLKLNKLTIMCTEGNNLDIVNNSEINNGIIDFQGNVLLENVKVNNTEINGRENLIVKLSQIKNSLITKSSYKGGTVKIINTEINDSKEAIRPYNSVIKAAITSFGGNIELENVKITNPGDYAVHAENASKLGGKIRIKGTLDIDGTKREAILLKNSYNGTESPLELYIDGDIKQKGDKYTVKAEKEGKNTKVYYDDNKIKRVIDKWSYVYYSTKNREGNEPQSIVYENKLVGENRYQTAIKVSNKGWTKSDNVVIVNSNSIADALSATPFAKYEDAPILLTESNKLNSETKKEISRLNAKNIYVIGGESSVSNSVINELKSMNITVERISGKDRYETSLELAKRIGYPWEIAVVNGVTGLPDAVSIAPVAAQKMIPIVLASPNDGTKVFDQYMKDNAISTSYIIGSERSISNEIANKLPNPQRLGGVDRNETNAAILEKFYRGEEINNIFVAKDGMKRSDDLIDALSVGVLASKENSPVVIVGDDLNDKQESLIYKKQPKEITKVGGNGNENAFNKLVNMFKN